jgi:hypothetical protein
MAHASESLMGEAPPLMVRVRAPATLPGGYTFEANLNDDPNRPFICEVVRYTFFGAHCLNLFELIRC